METKKTRNFWDVALSPEGGYIGIFLLTLFIITILGNFIYTFLTDFESLNGRDLFLTTSVILILSLITGFLWSTRKITKLPISVLESNELKDPHSVILIPSNTGVALTLIDKYSSLKHLWLVSNISFEESHKLIYYRCKEKDIKYHPIFIRNDEQDHLSNEFAVKAFPNIDPVYYQSINKGLDVAIHEAIKNSNGRKSKIIVDLTGGMKTMTISSLFYAMKHNVGMCYAHSTYEYDETGHRTYRLENEKPIIAEYKVDDIPFEFIYIPAETQKG